MRRAGSVCPHLWKTCLTSSCTALVIQQHDRGSFTSFESLVTPPHTPTHTRLRLGEVMYYAKPTQTQLARAAASLAITADFIRQVIADRSRDSALKPFITHQPVDLRPEPQ